MNEVRTTGSWLIIWLSMLALGALLWFSIIKQFDNGIQAAFIALFDPSSNVVQTEAASESNSELIDPIRSPVFALGISGTSTEVHAELPKGDLAQSVWTALETRSNTGSLKVNMEQYTATEGSDPEWLKKLPGFINKLPEQTKDTNLQLTINDEESTVLGKIAGTEVKEQLMLAVNELVPNAVMSLDAVEITIVEKPVLSIEKNGGVLELKGQLASEYLDNDFAGELKNLTNSTEVIDSLRYSSDISKAPSEFANIGAVSELLAASGSRSVIEIKDQQYNMNLFGYAGNNPDELRAQIADLLGDVPFQFSVGSVGSKELERLAEVSPEQQKPDAERSILAVNFGFNSYTLTPESEPALSSLLERMWASPELNLVIEGHTDSTGSPIFNQLLSQQRAEAVKNYLIDSGMSENRVEALGFGDEKPISSNATSEGRFKNRRIEVREQPTS